MVGSFDISKNQFDNSEHPRQVEVCHISTSSSVYNLNSHRPSYKFIRKMDNKEMLNQWLGASIFSTHVNHLRKCGLTESVEGIKK
jgi:hypothetical protein